MKTTWQSVKFDAANIVAQYVRVYSNGEIKVFDIDAKSKTIREWFITKDETPVEWLSDLRFDTFDMQQVKTIYLGKD